MLNLTANVMQEKEDLEQLVNAVVEAIGPEQIFCKHGFLLILIANKCQKPLSEYKVLLHDACPLLQPCQYALYNTLELERLLVEGHLFYSFLCQKEHLIYDSGTSPFPLSLFLRIHGVHEKATQVFSNGMARAFLFVEGAVFYMAKGALPLAAFMLHQAAEQALRTIILAVTGIEVRTHIIIELKQHLKKCAPQLSTFLAGPVEEDRRLLDKLEKPIPALATRLATPLVLKIPGA